MRGAVEVPPDGQPIMFLADHPTTCGYPIVAVAEPGSTDIAAQLRPGDRVHFRLTSPEPMQLGRRNRHGQQRDDIAAGNVEGMADG
jgi:allophanate hydrolase subunit 2